ncbi:MAG: T9SS type A sorting domain-containing protein [Phaeodactylibacter sp.]|nr:T9SS type A sorting domain-containing protein [Phaeodactylibacter sp.]
MKPLFRTLLPILPGILYVYSLPAGAQGCYTDPIYEVRVEEDVEYGLAINYCGFEEPLRMDLYRPVGDDNAKRPAIVLIHGGAFLSGDKGSYDMVEAARAFAARGYLAVSINYRLGFHKSVYYTPDAQGCALIGGLSGAQNAQCLYASPGEIGRALYRSVQDARGAIRFVKTRLDSVDANNVFVGGGSAGGFTAMSAAYMDDDESPEVALAQNPVSAIPLIYGACHPAGCHTERPDLGPPQGSLHTGQADASVKGVLNIFGALFDPSWIDAGEPLLYSYHKDNDLVVPCQNGQPFRSLVSRCLNNAACTAMPNTWPEAFGSCSLQAYLDTLANAPAHEFQIVNCTPPNFPCSYSCHEVTAEEVQQIVQGATEFWGCTITGQQQREKRWILHAFPNPAREVIELRAKHSGPPLEVTLYSLAGQPLQCLRMQEELNLDVSAFPPGAYILRVNDGIRVAFQKIVIQK